ncbi:class II aldolase/adducin family protein [Ahrensia kielensis]|uniref:Class II aldolase/adducin family protein n=1 Tax=Ahrensia kielensis TaxID=76980 RepID=A0ABU9TB70_9HYPH
MPRNSSAEALGLRKVLFMKNHGVLIAAETLNDATVSAYQLERACQIQILALSTNELIQEIDDKYASQLVAESCSGEPGYFMGMKRLLDIQQPASPLDL